jgi:predicted phosphatase
MNADVTAYVSSKDRYFTTLPTCIMSIINQTVKPQKFVLFLDGEKIDLRNNELYLGLFKLLDYYKIEWEVIFGEGKGQVLNHQKIIEIAKTEWIWRVDDDCFPETNVLETLFRYVDHIGAIAGLVIDPNNIKLLPDDVDGKIENIYNGQNVQWYLHKDDFCIEVDHLYSTFLYRKSAAKHGYCSELSPVGHREETIFTHQMKRNGFKLLVNPKCITWHC